jgi:hypothetical protein
MEPNSAANVSTGKPMASGAAFSAPTGTALPVDATTALAAAFKNIGYISDEGLTNAITTESESFKAWGGDIVGNAQTSFEDTFAFTALETNLTVLKEYYGIDNASESEGLRDVVHSSADLPYHAWVFQILLNGNRTRRIVIPDGKITERGELVYVDNVPIGYPITISARVFTVPDGKIGTVREYEQAIPEEE